MIKKTSQVTPIIAQVVNTNKTSETDAYSCSYVNTELNKKQDKYVELYSSSSGSSTTIQLNDNITNYNYIEVIYCTTDGTQYKGSSGKIPAVNNTEINLEYNFYASGAMYDKMARVKINGTSLTFSANMQVWFTNNGTNNIQDAVNTIKILKVLGYK